MRPEGEENPNCLRTHVTFRLAGADLNPAQVSSLLELEPSEAFARGEQVDILTQPAQTGIWSLSTQDLLSSTSPEKHLEFLLDRLEPAATRLLELVNAQALQVDFFCYWLSATGHGGPVLSPDILRRISNLGAVLGLDIYFDDPTDFAEEPESVTIH